MNISGLANGFYKYLSAFPANLFKFPVLVKVLKTFGIFVPSCEHIQHKLSGPNSLNSQNETQLCLSLGFTKKCLSRGSH